MPPSPPCRSAAREFYPLGSIIMVIFKSESDLISVIETHDNIVLECVRGSLNFWDFVEKYHNFYWYYALDGHESDEEERVLLEKHESRILPHREIAETILQGVCSDEDAEKEIYQKASRFGSKVAFSMLKEIASKYFNGQCPTQQSR